MDLTGLSSKSQFCHLRVMWLCSASPKPSFSSVSIKMCILVSAVGDAVNRVGSRWAGEVKQMGSMECTEQPQILFCFFFFTLFERYFVLFSHYKISLKKQQYRNASQENWSSLWSHHLSRKKKKKSQLTVWECFVLCKQKWDDTKHSILQICLFFFPLAIFLGDIYFFMSEHRSASSFFMGQLNKFWACLSYQERLAQEGQLHCSL